MRSLSCAVTQAALIKRDSKENRGSGWLVPFEALRRTTCPLPQACLENVPYESLQPGMKVRSLQWLRECNQKSACLLCAADGVKLACPTRFSTISPCAVRFTSSRASKR